MRKRGLAPLVDERIETLVLGSFPSVASLNAREYYAHPQNHFWKIMAALTRRPLDRMAYDERLPALLASGIGIWDVIAACEREGSGDDRIENVKLNNFSRFTAGAPLLKRVCFNGQAAAKLGMPVFAGTPYELCVLPSTSPRNARLPLAEKVRLWSEAVSAGGR